MTLIPLVIAENNKMWKDSLLKFLYSEFCEKRISQIFDIIVDFPESENSVKDLAIALEKSQKYAALVEGIESALKKRLLVPGATTEIILQMYSI